MSFQPVKNPVVTFELETPIQFLGQPITAIAVRQPTAADLMRLGGEPVESYQEPWNWKFNYKVAFQLLSVLSGIPVEGSLELMQADDAKACLEECVGPFFVRGLMKRLVRYKAERQADLAALLSSEKPDAQPAG